MYNFTIDQNADVVINVPAAGATAGQKIMVKFFDTKVNIFNIATPDLGGVIGAIVFNEATDYEFTVTAAQALKAIPTNTITYELYLLSAYGAAATLVESGTITVTALTGAEVLETVPHINSDNKKTVSGTAYTLLVDDDIVYLNPSVGTTLEVTLPDATIMPSKRFELYLIGAGDASVIVPEGLGELVALGTTNDACFIRAKGDDDADDWKVFYRYIQP